MDSHIPHLLHLTDDQLSMSYRAIVWDDIVLGSNKKGGKLSEGNYVKTWKPFIWGPLSRHSLLGDNYLKASIIGKSFCGVIVWVQIFWVVITRQIIILRGNCLEEIEFGSNCPSANYWKEDNYLGGGGRWSNGPVFEQEMVHFQLMH